MRIAAGIAVALSLLATAAGARPLVAILADPSGTETTDLIAPYAILMESGAVDVQIVSPTMAPVPLMPGVAWVKPQADRASFDRAHPGGADMVIVPFMMNMKDPARAAWLRGQAKHGARIVSICAGAEALAYAGLLEGRQATSHWSSIKGLSKHYPRVTWRRDARWVTDGKITTSAGVSASIPTALYLLEELAGAQTMRATAARLGLEAPSPTHNGAGFSVDAANAGVAAGNYLTVWNHQDVAVPIADGFDDLWFAASLDGWSRTFRSKAYAVSAAGTVTSRRGLVVLSEGKPRSYARSLVAGRSEPERGVLAEISKAYGQATAQFVALQLEHPSALAGAR